MLRIGGIRHQAGIPNAGRWRAPAMMSVIERRRRALARGSSYARFRLRTNRNKSNDAESISGTIRRFAGTCAFRVSDDQNGPSSSPWSLVAQHADETAVIRDPCSVLRVARQRENREPASSSRSAAAVTDAYGGVPEPALSEPAQQLIGARSGGERGYYRTTTPRFGEIQFRVL